MEKDPDEPREPSVNEVTDLPDGFKDWIADNADRIEAAEKRGTQPYFIRDNREAVDEALKPGVETKQGPDYYDGINVIHRLSKLSDAEFLSLMQTGHIVKVGEVACGDSSTWREFQKGSIGRQEFMLKVEENFGEYGEKPFAQMPITHVICAAERMNITPSEKSQIKTHNGGGYIATSNSFKMNGCLRNKSKIDPYSKNEWTKDDTETVKALDTVIRNNKIKVDTTLYRMVDTDFIESYTGQKINEPWKIQNVFDATKDILNKPLTNDGYTSASFNPNLNVMRRDIQLRIKTPKDTSMYITENYAESEAILSRGLTLKPTKVSLEGWLVIVDCEIM